MLVAQSHHHRRFIGRLDRGEELCGAIRALCKEQDILSGEIRAWGLLSGVELVPYDREARGYTTPKRLRSFFELLQLSGTIATRDGEVVLQLHATLSRDNTDRGGSIDILGGLVTAAEVLTCELSIVSFDDVTLVREFDPALGVYALTRGEPRPFLPGSQPGGAAGGTTLPAAAGERFVPAPARPTSPTPPAPATPRPPPPREPDIRMRKGVLLPPTISIPEGEPMRSRSVNTPTATYHAEASGAAAQAGGAAGGGASSSGAAGGGEPSWADAMQRSQALSTTPERAVRPGDVIEHPKFGRCDVMRVDDGEERISVRIPAGRLVELGLEVLQLELVRTEGTKQFYKVHMSRR